MNKIFTLLFAVVLIINGCGQGTSTPNYESGTIKEYAPPRKGPPVDASQTKLIKSGNLTILSKNIEKDKNLINSIVQQCNGSILVETFEKSDESNVISYSIRAKIVSDCYELFQNLIDSSKLDISYKSFEIQDVTAEFIDNAKRLETKKKLETRYYELLKQAKTVNDVIKIEDKLSTIRADIETQEGQFKVLNNEIDYSHFSIRIEQKQTEVVPKSSYLKSIFDGIKQGWEFAKNIVVFLIIIWPVYILAGIGLFIFFKIRKKRKQHKEKV
jgi:hypothetical protein